jgi:hypothetical protein
MLTQSDLAEFLEEIRREVCSHCPERPPGGPPCEPLGKRCGVEMHLARLVGAVQEVHSDLVEPYVEHNHQEICSDCALHNNSSCPCPMDYLSVLVVGAVENVAARSEQWDCVRRRLCVCQRPKADQVPVAEWCRAYEEATGTCIGCD